VPLLPTIWSVKSFLLPLLLTTWSLKPFLHYWVSLTTWSLPIGQYNAALFSQSCPSHTTHHQLPDPHKGFMHLQRH
jgi:hypothetical protein